MGKYVCGCVTLLKVQLKDGTFHEDMGYCYTEGAMKGLTIHCARIVCLKFEYLIFMYIIEVVFFLLFYSGFSYRCL